MTVAELLAGPVTEAAVGLLGRRLRSSTTGRATEVLLTEVEAYDGREDPASHAYRGLTSRNATMFGPSGRLYVYRSYGIHWCMNVVCGPPGTASAVLLRGGIPLVGIDVMEKRRGRRVDLTDGPGKLCQALGISGEHDGTSIFDGPVSVSRDRVGGRIEATPRIGISKAMDREWRFVLEVAAGE